jgi:diguanylate cyclase (GGDEF)-like protein
MLRLNAELERGQRFGTPTAILMIDLDHFKNVNDSYGHLIGHGVLKEAGRRLNQSVRSYDFVEDMVARISGRSLECTPDQLQEVAERARYALAQAPIAADAQDVRITVSIDGAVADSAASATSRSMISERPLW